MPQHAQAQLSPATAAAWLAACEDARQAGRAADAPAQRAAQRWPRCPWLALLGVAEDEPSLAEGHAQEGLISVASARMALRASPDLEPSLTQSLGKALAAAELHLTHALAECLIAQDRWADAADVAARLRALDADDALASTRLWVATSLRAVRPRALRAVFPAFSLSGDIAWAGVLACVDDADLPTAARALRHAQACNPHVRPCLLGQVDDWPPPPTHAPGSVEEGMLISASQRVPWRACPGALEWLMLPEHAGHTSPQRRADA